jgi:hypothetical protein
MSKTPEIPESSRPLAGGAALHNFAALGLSGCLALTGTTLAIRHGVAHYAPAPMADIGAMKFVGGGTAMIARPVAGPANAAGTATAMDYSATWRAVAAEGVRANLEDAGVYWFQGGPTTPGSERRRHHLKVTAKSGPEALSMARSMLQQAGASKPDVELGGPLKPE